MTEEVKEEAGEEAVVDQTTPAPTEVETQASEQGWMSKEAWVESGKDASEWRPAKEFVERGELFKHIHTTKRELKQTQAALTALQRHHQFVYEKAHQQAIKDLRHERRAALQDEDIDRVEAIEAEIETLNTKHQQESQQLQAEVSAATAGPHPMFQAWANQNSWYNADEELRDFADAIGIVYAGKHPEAKSNPQVVLDYVAKEVRKKYPEKFGTRKAAPNPTAGVDRSGRAGPPSKDVEMDDMERDIMNTLVKTGVMTEKEYRAQLKQAKGGK